MRKTLLLIMSRKSGAGKSYLERELVRLDPTRFHKIVSCTTRPPRLGEVDSVDYYFISEKEFQDLVATGRMVQVTTFNGYRYGSTEAEYMTAHPYAILTLTPESAVRFLPEFYNRWFFYDIKVIYFDISDKKIIENMFIRGDEEDTIKQQFSNDDLEQQWKESGIVADFVVTDEMLIPDLPIVVVDWLDKVEAPQELKNEV